MYSLSVSVSNLHAMYQPVPSIPHSGTVPTKVTGIPTPNYLLTPLHITLSELNRLDFIGSVYLPLFSLSVQSGKLKVHPLSIFGENRKTKNVLE